MPHTSALLKEKDTKVMQVVRGIPPEMAPDRDKLLEFRADAEVKQKILDLFESMAVSTLSEAAQRVGIKKYKAYKMKRADPEWAEELKIAHEIVADKIEEELRDSRLLTEEKYPGVMSRIFLLNGLRPDKYKGTKLTVENPKFEEELRKIREIGQRIKGDA